MIEKIYTILVDDPGEKNESIVGFSNAIEQLNAQAVSSDRKVIESVFEIISAVNPEMNPRIVTFVREGH